MEKDDDQKAFSRSLRNIGDALEQPSVIHCDLRLAPLVVFDIQNAAGTSCPRNLAEFLQGVEEYFTGQKFQFNRKDNVFLFYDSNPQISVEDLKKWVKHYVDEWAAINRLRAVILPDETTSPDQQPPEPGQG